jgi:hypothetical protein
MAMSCACGRSPLAIAEGGGEGSFGQRPDDDERDDVDGDGVQTCREVDFLFVVDDSPTMAMYQQNLVENYEVFIDGIEEAISQLETIHVGVVTTEAYEFTDAACQQLGGLVVATGGPSSSEADCRPFAAGTNFMTERDDFDRTFRCAAKVGTGGTDNDAPLAAIASAVSSPLADEGACNAGFVGEGALLVVVIVSDTYPTGAYQLDVDPYFAASVVLDAMGDIEDVVVVLIASIEDAPCLNPLAPQLEDFADFFPHSYKGPICSHDYTEVFTPAIEIVKGACP